MEANRQILNSYVEASRQIVKLLGFLSVSTKDFKEVSNDVRRSIDV